MTNIEKKVFPQYDSWMEAVRNEKFSHERGLDLYCGLAGLTVQALFQDKILFETAEEFTFNGDYSKLISEIEAYGYNGQKPRLVNDKFLFTKEGTVDISRERIYAWNEAFLDFDLDADTQRLIIVVKSLDKDWITGLVQGIFHKYKLKEKKLQGKVHMIVQTQAGYQVELMGSSGQPLEEGNYTEKVLDSYNYIKKELERSKPNGKIVIMEGAAGLGKTSMVKGLINAVEGVMFVIVPPALMGLLGDPQFIPMLKTIRKEEVPICLVIEDADHALQSRDDGNIRALSTLLNMSDGILSDQFDLRILATTNKPITEIDSALVRSGRLSRYVAFTKLSVEQANDIFFRLTKTEGTYIEEKVLADIYADSRGVENSFQEEKPKKSSVGFGSK